MSSFVGSVQQFIANRSRWFLQNKNIGRFMEAAGLTYDSALESVAQGLKLSQPLRCDSSALPYLSRDRGVRLYPTEPLASQRYRLSQWWQLHRQRGTHQGEMRHSAPYFQIAPSTAPLLRIVHQDGNGATATWHTLDCAGTYTVHRATTSNWDFDGVPSKWSRFWVIAYLPASMLNVVAYDDGGVFDGGEVYDGVITTPIALDLIAMIRDWKSSHSIMWGYIIATDPASFDPAASAVIDPTGWTSLPIGNWGSPVDGNGNRTRPPTAFWIYDLGQG